MHQQEDIFLHISVSQDISKFFLMFLEYVSSNQGNYQDSWVLRALNNLKSFFCVFEDLVAHLALLRQFVYALLR